MKILLFFMFALFLISCGQSPIVNQLQGSDSLAISFVKPGTNEVRKVVETSSKYAIKDLIHFADAEETQQFKCGYDGNALFYKKGILAGEITFNYSGDGCQHFLYMANGKLTASKMSYQAIDFLKALATGKP